MTMITPEALAELIAPMLAGTYHCNRVWSAWHVGTMSEDDFAPVEESDTPHEIADAILAALPELLAAQPQDEHRGEDEAQESAYFARWANEPPVDEKQPASSKLAQDADTRVDGGALRMALNVLRRAGKHEVADTLESTAIRQPVSAGGQEPVAWQLRTDEAHNSFEDDEWQPVTRKEYEAIKSVMGGHGPKRTAGCLARGDLRLDEGGWFVELRELFAAPVAAEAAPQAVDLSRFRELIDRWNMRAGTGEVHGYRAGKRDAYLACGDQLSALINSQQKESSDV
jgi:hypothetical protein